MEERYAHPTWIEVDLGQFRKNIAIIRNYIGRSLFCLPVKANAYGHGLCGIGVAAADAGVDYLGVSCLQEGVNLRQAGVQIPILVFGAVHENQVDDLIHFNLEFTISSKYKAGLVAARCETLQRKCRIHLEVDTGMQRTGVRCSTAEELFPYLKSLKCFEVVGIYSHLASSDRAEDPIAEKQIQAFQGLIEHPKFEGHLRHLANSGGVAHYRHAHLDMVRPGLLAYGYLPENPPAELQGIAPCFSLKSKVSYFKVVAKGEGISYNHTYITPSQTRIVTVPIGYGDGYRRKLSNRGAVLIRGKRFPIVGIVCMDQCMINIGMEEVYVGDEVVLIGKQGFEEIGLLEIAHLCETVPYEVLCFFNSRIPRIYGPA
ncbi:MAG: alanine racemase [Chlamydiota bacterium]